MLERKRQSSARNLMPPEDGFSEQPGRHEDLTLVRNALRGDEQAIRLVAERSRIIPRLLEAQNRRQGGMLSAEDIEDLSQDVTLKILRKLSDYRGQGSFDSWVSAFCILSMRNRVRRESFRRGVVRLEGYEDPVESERDLYIDGEALWRHVGTLDARDQRIIEERHRRGLTFSEIGRELALAHNVVKTRYYRALKRLREVVKPTEGSEAS